MSIRLAYAASAATTILLSASAASAATYDLYREHENTWFGTTNPIQTQMTLVGQDTVFSQIGGYDISAVRQDKDDPVWTFVGWCVDLFTPLATDTDMYITQSNATFEEPDHLAPSADRFDMVELLFDTVYTSSIAEDRILAAGFQLAIWELLYETQDNLNVFVGDFFASNYAGGLTSAVDEQAARYAANDYLAMLASTTGPLTDHKFIYFTTVDGMAPSQVLIQAIPLPPPMSEVPLPAPALLLLGGLTALGAMRRRKT